MLILVQRSVQRWKRQMLCDFGCFHSEIPQERMKTVKLELIKKWASRYPVPNFTKQGTHIWHDTTSYHFSRIFDFSEEKSDNIPPISGRFWPKPPGNCGHQTTKQLWSSRLFPAHAVRSDAWYGEHSVQEQKETHYHNVTKLGIHLETLAANKVNIEIKTKSVEPKYGWVLLELAMHEFVQHLREKFHWLSLCIGSTDTTDASCRFRWDQCRCQWFAVWIVVSFYIGTKN